MTTPEISDEQRAWYAAQSSQYFEETAVHSSAKRCGVQWTPWMGDWFTSWSPRNSNNHAEGTWDHWVDLAIRILQDPLTDLVRPDARAAVADVKTFDFYDESNRHLTDDELTRRFAPPADPEAMREAASRLLTAANEAEASR